MAYQLTLRLGTVFALFVPAIPAVAQETGGLETVFGITQGLVYERNAPLSISTDDTDITAATQLSYGLTSNTRTQQLGFQVSDTFRIEDSDGETTSEFDSPTVTLSYARKTSSSSLDLSARFTRQNIDTLPSRDQFIDENGLVELPDDFTELVGSGQRDDYRVQSSLVVGVNAPLGFQFDLSASGTNYADTTGAGLTDIESASVGAIAKLRFSEVLSGEAGLTVTRTEFDDADETRRLSRALNLGLSYAVSERTNFGVSIGANATTIEERTFESDIDGFSGGVDLEHKLPNGAITASLSANRDAAGERLLNARFSRSLSLPTGSFTATIGATQPEGRDAAFIGALDWVRDGPASSLKLNLNRTVNVDLEADVRERTSAAAFFDYTVNDLSALNLGASYVFDEASTNTNQVERVDVSAAYNYSLTKTWTLTSGLSFAVRDEDTVGRGDSTSVSLSIGREFRSRR